MGKIKAKKAKRISDADREQLKFYDATARELLKLAEELKVGLDGLETEVFKPTLKAIHKHASRLVGGLGPAASGVTPAMPEEEPAPTQSLSATVSAGFSAAVAQGGVSVGNLTQIVDEEPQIEDNEAYWVTLEGGPITLTLARAEVDAFGGAARWYFFGSERHAETAVVPICKAHVPPGFEANRKIL